MGDYASLMMLKKHRLEFIKRVRSLGFSLDDVKTPLAVADGSRSGKAETIATIIIGIKSRMSDLTMLDVRLSSAVSGDLPFEEMEDAFRSDRQ